MSAGVYNAWIEKSLARLAELMPGRYAKTEISSGFLGSIDRYAYRQPERPAMPVDTPTPQSTAGSSRRAAAALTAPTRRASARHSLFEQTPTEE